jgi:hypothetical protein
VRRAIGIAFKRDGRHSDDRGLGKPPFQLVISRLAPGEIEPPTVIMDDDRDMIGIVERRRAAIKGGIIKVPFRRRDLPDELGKFAPVFRVAGRAAFGGEIILVPPLQLGLLLDVRPKFCSMKITQDLRAEVLAMSKEQRASLAQVAAQSEHDRREGMAQKSAEFLQKGGQLYVQAAE